MKDLDFQKGFQRTLSGYLQVALRSKDIIVGRAEKGRAESGWSMGELPGSPSFHRVVVVGGQRVCVKS